MKRGFKGIWIVKDIWENKDLNIQEKCLFAEIDSLDASEDHCYASDEYFIDFMGCSRTALHRMLKKLRDLGYVSNVSFDGRKRIMMSNLKTAFQENTIAVPKSGQHPSRNRDSTCPEIGTHITKGIKKEIKKDNVPKKETMPFSKKKEEDPKKFLNAEEKSYFDMLTSYVFEKGEGIDCKAASYWIKTWGIERVQEAVILYNEQAKKGNIPDSAGGYIRNALNKGLRPEREDDKINKGYALKNGAGEPLNITKKYVTFPYGIGDLYFNMPPENFKQTFDSKMDTMQDYKA